MSASLVAVAANPMAAVTVLAATASLADVGRRAALALVAALIVLARTCRRRTARAQALAAIPAQCRPWREGGYGLPRALGEAEYEAGRLRLAAVLENRSEGEQ